MNPDTDPANLPVAEGKRTETATLAGGCFWGVEHFLEKLEGLGADFSLAG